MGKPTQHQETISLARFKRALFFAPIIFWSCVNLAGWDHEFRVSSSKNSVGQTPSLRSFMQEGHATPGGTGRTQHDTHKSPNPKPIRQAHKTASDLLTDYHIDTNIFLSLQNIPSRNMHAHLQTKSYDNLHEIKQSLTQFFERFETDKRFRKQVAKIKQVGIYKKTRKKTPALKHYANHAYRAVCKILKETANSIKTLCRDFLQTNIGLPAEAPGHRSLCKNSLAKAGETAQYFLGRFMLGIKQAGIDIQAAIRRENRDGPL